MIDKERARRFRAGAYADRPVERSVRLLSGLLLFGLALALLVRADLGVDPWTVLAQGIELRTRLSLGQVTVVLSVLVLLTWVPLRQRPGAGTVGNALLVGPVLDLGLVILPTPESLLQRILCVLFAIVMLAVATGLYVGAGWGPGPRDGLMTGLAARGVPIFVARGSVELTVLVIGWLLGGQVGVATILFALSVGPLVHIAIPRLSIRPGRRVRRAAG